MFDLFVALLRNRHTAPPKARCSAALLCLALLELLTYPALHARRRATPTQPGSYDG